ncbi:MAG: EVE domain-containing protein [Gammaproteobacteria bacterium]|nr:EVE domain-containing protein [Gammaproteobacteria bacterium]
MNHWLMKSEPSTFGIDDLAAAPRKTTGWDGVRNFQVRNMLRDEFRKGDQAFFYHSSCPEPGIAGIVEIVGEAYADPTALDRKHPHYDPVGSAQDPRWYAVDVRLVRKFDRLISLDLLRAHAAGALRDMLILRRGNRLSVTPVTREEWEFILSLK